MSRAVAVVGFWEGFVRFVSCWSVGLPISSVESNLILLLNEEGSNTLTGLMEIN